MTSILASTYDFHFSKYLKKYKVFGPQQNLVKCRWILFYGREEAILKKRTLRIFYTFIES